MEEYLKLEARGLGLDYYNHDIFPFLDDVYDWYSFLSYRCGDYADGLLLTGRQSINTSIYASLQGTMESIKILIYIGRLNDVFVLVRKFEDAVYTDIYKNILLTQEENSLVDCSVDLKKLFKNSKIRKWTFDTCKLIRPNDLQKVKEVLKEVDNTLADLFDFNNTSPYRKTCNDNVHYNSWSNFAINDICFLQYKKQGVQLLNTIKSVLIKSVAIHFSYLYIMFPQYFMTDFDDECTNPSNKAYYEVASIVQDIFDKYIKRHHGNVAKYLLEKDLMNLE